jgi:hypothetical protein
MSKEFLLDTVYWDESVWYIHEDRYPTLVSLVVDTPDEEAVS